MKFEYIFQRARHTDTNREYMLNLGMDTDAIESVLSQKTYEEDQKWATVREKRDALIAATDYTQVADSPFSEEKQLEFQVYREELRNVPQTFDDPYEITWPAQPK